METSFVRNAETIFKFKQKKMIDADNNKTIATYAAMVIYF